MNQAAASTPSPLAELVSSLPPILTNSHRTFFQQHGYMVVPTGIEPDKLARVVDVIWDFLGMDPANPEDWYRPPHNPGGMIELYQHQALWDIRQHPRLYQIFREGNALVAIDGVM